MTVGRRLVLLASTKVQAGQMLPEPNQESTTHSSPFTNEDCDTTQAVNLMPALSTIVVNPLSDPVPPA